MSEQYLEERLATSRDDAKDQRVVRVLSEWRRHQTLGPASSLRSMLEAGAEPLVRALGFTAADDIWQAEAMIGAALRGQGAPLTLIVTRYGEPLDPVWRPAIHQACARAAEWCLVFNGTHVRLLHAARAASRRFAEFDLDAAADDEQTARALWTLLSAEAFGPAQGGDQTAAEAMVDASDRHGLAVCQSLRRGVLEASECVLGAFLSRRKARLVREEADKTTDKTTGATAAGAVHATGDAPIDEAFAQALTLVYRLLFLFFAEARALVPVWHPVYRDSYSLERLSMAAASGDAGSLWEALRAVSRLAHAGCRAGDLRVTPFNGRLFAPSRTPLVERADLDEDAARRALIALSSRPAPGGEGRARIAYRDLGVGQLGAVYETLLDYAPSVASAVGPTVAPSVASAAASALHRQPGARSARTTRRVSLQPGSGARKRTGSFYTPEPIVRYLLRRTLGPLVRDAPPERILSLRVLDPSMGSGAFLVGACTFLADAYEAALIKGGGCHASDLGPGERALIRRTVAERCLYGVDLNPMAVQLARLSLWLATLAAERPLSFLDHHLLTGNSLLGTWVSCLGRAPANRASRTPLPLFADLPVNEVLRDALPIRFTLASGPTDTLEHVRAKERALSELARHHSPLSRWKRVADLWCSRWLAPDVAALSPLFASLSDAILTGRSALPATTVGPLLARASAAAAEQRLFHWELEFPEVFFDEAGARRTDAGFDAVVGNPPWDMLRDDSPEGGGASQPAGAAARAVRFSRDAGVYRAQTSGQANCYQLFLERSMALTRPGGRIGMVLPSGLSSDHGSAALRRLLLTTCDVDALVGFDNRRGIFPIHRSVRFLLLTGQMGRPTRDIPCRLGEVDPATLEAAADEEGAVHRAWFPVSLNTALLERLSGGDLSIPEVRTPMDLTIAERATTAFAPLGAADGWDAHFGRELNATEDRDCIAEGSRRALPVVEGKLLEPFIARVDQARGSVSATDAAARLGDRHRRPRLAYRDVASATNRTTLIAALLPADCVSTHTLFCLKTPLPRPAQHYLCGLFNSFVLNYLARLRVTTHVTTAIVERLPVPTQAQAGPAFGAIAALARILGRRRQADAMAQLHARVARLYRLSDDEFTHIVGTFPLVSSAEREAALLAFRRS